MAAGGVARGEGKEEVWKRSRDVLRGSDIGNRAQAQLCPSSLGRAHGRNLLLLTRLHSTDPSRG